jgi:hypothetical protein
MKDDLRELVQILTPVDPRMPAAGFDEFVFYAVLGERLTQCR